MKGAALLLAVLGGFLLVNLCLAPRPRFWARMFLFLTIGAGLGIGLVSLLFFLFLNIPQAGQLRLDNRTAIGGLIILLVGGTFGMLAYRMKGRAPSNAQADSPEGRNRLKIVLGALLLGSTLLSLYTFAGNAVANPQGGWDAWAIWNFHARFLFRGGNDWQALFNPGLAWSHVDYPLLTPGMIAMSWKLSGKENYVDPLLLAAIFTFNVAGLAFGALYLFRGFVQAALAAIVILCTPAFIISGTYQFADIPLSFFLLASIVLLVYYEMDPRPQYGALALSGVLAGLTAWTKNEGLGIVAAVVISKALADLLYKTRRSAIREWAAFGAGLLPVLAVIGLFKQEAKIANYMFSQDTTQIFAKLGDLERYRLIFSKLGEKVTFGWGGGLVSIFLLLLIWAVWQGLDRSANRKAVFFSLLIPLFTLATYLLAYLITPLDLKWQVSSSLSRLLAQIFPSVVLCVFLLARAPFAGPSAAGGSTNPLASGWNPINGTSAQAGENGDLHPVDYPSD